MDILTKTFFWLDDCPYDGICDWSRWAAESWYLENWAHKAIIKVTNG